MKPPASSASLPAHEPAVRSQWHLEPENRPETHFQIVTRAVIEIDLVASIQTEADRTPESFNAKSGQNRRASVAGRNAAQGAHKTLGNILIAGTEVNKSHFDRGKRAERTRTRHEFGAKERVQGAHMASYELGIDSIREDTREIPARSHNSFLLRSAHGTER